MPHKTTGFSPYQKLYDQKAKTSNKAGQTTYIHNVSYNHAAELHAHNMDAIFTSARTKAQAARDVRAAA